MTALASTHARDQTLARIEQDMQAGRMLQAEVTALKLLESWPDLVPALVALANCAAAREDQARAATFWARASQASPLEDPFAYQWAMALASSGDLPGAERVLLERHARLQGLGPECWLLLGHVRQHLGQSDAALRAWFRAVHLAQQKGRWHNEATTDPALLPWVMSAMQALAPGRKAVLNATLEPLRQQLGRDALQRVDRALANYLGEVADGPRDPRQRPKFLYIPGLPDQPYHDPYLHPWAPSLAQAFPVIREEALGLLEEGGGVFESFLSFGPGVKVADYVGGEGPKPSWDAFFFYRHGQRYDEHHARCPQTSAVLEGIELCRVRGQAPEVCFSLLAPGSHIKPHYGVTNSRLVMHLPLRVPADCALNVIDAGAHVWQEGQLMMFDDCFQHEAWNRSTETRLILLMDCWNPHLSEAEKLAITALVECISDFERGI